MRATTAIIRKTLLECEPCALIIARGTRRMMKNWLRFLICLAVGLAVLIAPVAYQLYSGVEISGAQRLIMVMGAVGLGWFLTGRM
jgi:hypothetical protein